MTISVVNEKIQILSIYKRATTPARKALGGFMIKTGRINNSILGGSFNLLCKIEKCMVNKEIYTLFPVCETKVMKDIIWYAQNALDGEYDSFSIPEKERNSMIKWLSEDHYSN